MNMDTQRNDAINKKIIPHLQKPTHVKDVCLSDYQKRSGTSGLTGQLYETKLLTLILLRALNNDNIKEFILATNMDGVGAFDDIILRYKTSYPQKEKIIFLQAKHKDDPNKDKLTVKDIMKPDGDFSLQKYLESFIKIKQKCITDKTNKMFLELNNDIEYEYIIYTSANEQFDVNKTIKCSNVEDIIRTNKKGKYFQFVCDAQDIELLVTEFEKSRAIALAKALSNFINKDNWNNIMLHDLMRTYHVFIAQNIITVECTSTETKDSKDSVSEEQLHNVGRFRHTFWTSLDDNLMLIKNVLIKETAEIKGRSIYNPGIDIVDILKSLVFKLPTEFGNISFNFHGNEKKQQKRFDHVCSIFHKLLQNMKCDPDSENIYVKLDDDSVGPNKIFQRQDLESYRLGGLVGNLLINDDKTDMLKFNLNIDNLSKDNIKMLNYLQKDFDLTKYRFDINVYNFPKLKLNCRENDIALLKDFLHKLKFFTNQSKEDEVENIVKQEIDKLFSVKQRQQDSLFCIKCDAIFLKIHDKIQKWWKERNFSSYLTKTCRFYEEAEQEILQSPLLSIVNFNYRSILNNNLAKFNDEVINSLNLVSFLSSNERMLIFVTKEISFTSIKIIQYFDTLKKENDYIFIDLEFLIVENRLEIVQLELECSVIPLLIVISRDCNDTSLLKERLNTLTKLFKGKIIMISNKSLEDKLKISLPESRLQSDDNNYFSSFSKDVRNLILENKVIDFHGVEVPVAAVFDNISLSLLSPNLLHNILHNDKVEIGKTLATEFYYKTMNHYIQQSVCRYITVNYEPKGASNKLISMEEIIKNSLPKENQDIVVTTPFNNTFEELCKLNSDNNVHWFTKINETQMLWNVSHGSLHRIKKFTNRGFHDEFSFKLRSLKDIQEKVVIISAEPGMGKSTFLTHIAYNTKRLYPHLWIIKINLIDHVNLFSKWKKNKTNINLVQVMNFLYNVINLENNNVCEDSKMKLTITECANNEVDLTNSDEHLPDVDLSEVKLLNYFYNNNNLAILLDGFDEICPDFANEVIRLLCAIKSSKVIHLWVTSRLYNVLDRLELALCTFSFNLNPLTTLEQEFFLQTVWAPKICTKEEDRITYAKRFLFALSSFIHDTEGKLLSLPLHLLMIIEVYDEYFNNYEFLKECPSMHIFLAEYFSGDTNIKVHLNTFYEEFINKKYFQIRFGEKKHFMSFMDPDVRKIVEKEYKVFLDNHKKIAAHYLLDKNIMLTKTDIEDVREFVASIKSGEEKTGIIERIVDNEPKFVHLTFAEYFAAEFILDKLKSPNCTLSICQYILNHVLVEKKYLYIRRFINGRLWLERSEDIKLSIYENHMKTIFNLLLKQGKYQLTSAMYTSYSENLECITIFLLLCVKANIKKHNLSKFIKYMNQKQYGFRCLFCGIIDKHGRLAVELILEIVTDTDSSQLKDLFHCIDKDHPLILAFIEDDEIAKSMLVSLQDKPKLMSRLLTVEHVNITHLTILQLIAKQGSRVDYWWEFLQNLNNEQLIKILYMKDRKGHIALHYAGMYGNYDFFYKIHELLGREKFRKMCITASYTGFTPTYMLSKYGRSTYHVQTIIEYVYEGIDVVNTPFYKLPLIYPTRSTCVIM